MLWTSVRFYEMVFFLGKLGDYLATDASLVMQGQILDSACQAQKDKADKEDAASLGRHFYTSI